MDYKLQKGRNTRIHGISEKFRSRNKDVVRNFRRMFIDDFVPKKLEKIHRLNFIR
jgi:hypothetical protein